MTYINPSLGKTGLAIFLSLGIVAPATIIVNPVLTVEQIAVLLKKATTEDLFRINHFVNAELLLHQEVFSYGDANPVLIPDSAYESYKCLAFLGGMELAYLIYDRQLVINTAMA